MAVTAAFQLGRREDMPNIISCLIALCAQTRKGPAAAQSRARLESFGVPERLVTSG